MRANYKGYTFADVTTRTESGRFKARAAIMALDGGRTRSQRFIDLETFSTEQEAGARVVAAAKAWIDADLGQDKLALPSSFMPFE